VPEEIAWQRLVSPARARREVRRLAVAASALWASPVVIALLVSRGGGSSALWFIGLGVVLGGFDVRRRLKEFDAWTRIECSSFGMRVPSEEQSSVVAWQDVRGVALDEKGQMILDLGSANGCVLLTRQGVDPRAWTTIVEALSPNWPCVREREQIGAAAA